MTRELRQEEIAEFIKSSIGARFDMQKYGIIKLNFKR